MKKLVIMLFMASALSGCYMNVHMPALIQSNPVERNEHVNKGVVREVCGGSVVVVNESRVRIQAFQDNYSRNADQVHPGFPYEHIFVEGYDQYGQLVGVVEKTFVCGKRGMVEQWVIHDWMLWNYRR